LRSDKLMKSINNHRKGSLRLHIIPVIVWLVALGAVIILFQNRTQRFESIGLVEGEERRIAATVPGRITSVPVHLFDKVNEGDVVVVVDTVLNPKSLEIELETRKEVLLATIRQLQAELIATRDRLMSEEAERQNDLELATRRYAADVEDAKLQVVELKATIAPDKVRLKELDLNIKILTVSSAPIQNQEKITQHYEIERLKTQSETLAKQIEENEKLLAQAEENLQQANERLQVILKKQPINPSIELALQPIREEIKVEEQTILELMRNRPALEITSPFNGTVSRIRRRVGEIILAQDPILNIVESEPRVIVAYIREPGISQVKENMKVKVLKRSYPMQQANSYVAYMGPGLEELPPQLWANTTTPQWGRPVLIPIPAGMELIPGETVGISGL
jgi:multidrug resistance efflux pump